MIAGPDADRAYAQEMAYGRYRDADPAAFVLLIALADWPAAEPIPNGAHRGEAWDAMTILSGMAASEHRTAKITLCFALAQEASGPTIDAISTITLAAQLGAQLRRGTPESLVKANEERRERAAARSSALLTMAREMRASDPHVQGQAIARAFIESSSSADTPGPGDGYAAALKAISRLESEGSLVRRARKTRRPSALQSLR